MAIKLTDYLCPEVSHTGEVTGFTILTITDNAVTVAKLADIATQSLMGRNTAGTGDPEVLDMPTVRAMMNVAEQTDWPMIRNSIDVGESHTIPDRFQMIVANEMVVDGTLDAQGELIVLDDADPQTTHPIGPDFTYTLGVLTRIDYDGGEYKIFTYGGGGELTVVDYVSNGITKRKEFFYGLGGELSHINQTYI